MFLDRDGVVNRVIMRDGRPASPLSLAELHLLPGVVDAVARLRDAGYVVVLATNQPDAAAGTREREVAERLNEEVRRHVPLDGVKVCYHRDGDGCACRKPKPGLLLEAAREWSLDLRRSFMVGDRWRDVSAGRAAGCTTVLVGDGYGEAFPDAPDLVAASVVDASAMILSHAGAGPHGGA